MSSRDGWRPGADVPEEWVLVPKEPTAIMREAGAVAFDGPMAVVKMGDLCADIFAAMLAAAPLPPPPKEPPGDG